MQNLKWVTRQERKEKKKVGGGQNTLNLSGGQRRPTTSRVMRCILQVPRYMYTSSRTSIHNTSMLILLILILVLLFNNTNQIHQMIDRLQTNYLPTLTPRRYTANQSPHNYIDRCCGQALTTACVTIRVPLWVTLQLSQYSSPASSVQLRSDPPCSCIAYVARTEWYTRQRRILYC